jgi:hypothetical protein
LDRRSASSRIFGRRAPTPVLTEGHGPQANRTHAQSGTTQCDKMIKGHRFLRELSDRAF